MTCRPIFSLQTPTCSDTSSWQRWRWARVDNGNETAARRPRANLRPFPPPEPSDLSSYKLYLPLSTFSSSPVDSSWWQPCQKRRNHLPVTDKHISSAVCDPPSSFFLSLFFSLFLPQVLWFLSLDAVSKETLKKKRNIMKIHGRSCNIYSYKPIIVVESKRSFSPYTWQTDICVIQQMFKKHGKHFVSALSRSLFLSVLFWTLEENLGGLGKLDHTGRRAGMRVEVCETGLENKNGCGEAVYMCMRHMPRPHPDLIVHPNPPGLTQASYPDSEMD